MFWTQFQSKFYFDSTDKLSRFLVLQQIEEAFGIFY